MKNKIIIIGLLFSAIFSSCTDWLDPKPLDTMILEDFWKTRDDVESVLMSCYEGMTQKDFMQRIIIGGEVRSDNVKGGLRTSGDDASSYAELLNEKIQPTNVFAKWDAFYKVINRCNTVIRYAPEVRAIDPDYTEGYLKLHLAEAYTIRALVYFYLVRIYDKVPYITDASIDDSQNYKIGNDLEGDTILARELVYLDSIARPGAAATRGNILVFGNAQQTKGRITKNAVNALMADMYLWIGNYEECITACEAVMENQMVDGELDYSSSDEIDNASSLSGTELALLSNKTYVFRSYNYLFTYTNSFESIFELQFNTTNNGHEAMKDFYGSLNSSTFWFYARDLYTDGVFKAETNILDQDIRSITSLGEVEGDADSYRVNKYLYEILGTSSSGSYIIGAYIPASYPTNWIFYRLPDILLMKAEALIESDPERYSTALSLINRVYQRSNPDLPALSSSQYSTKETLTTLLLLERQREFLFEGKRWFDLVRYAKRNGPSDVLNYVSAKHAAQAETVKIKFSNMNAFYLPIHRDELTVTGEILNQNPYYKTGIE